jgi:hypothetical protein
MKRCAVEQADLRATFRPIPLLHRTSLPPAERRRRK